MHLQKVFSRASIFSLYLSLFLHYMYEDLCSEMIPAAASTQIHANILYSLLLVCEKDETKEIARVLAKIDSCLYIPHVHALPD